MALVTHPMGDGDLGVLQHGPVNDISHKYVQYVFVKKGIKVIIQIALVIASSREENDLKSLFCMRKSLTTISKLKGTLFNFKCILVLSSVLFVFYFI